MFGTKGLTVGKLPSKFKEEIPPKPFDIDTNIEARKKWSKLKRAICDANETKDSKILLTKSIFEIAEDYEKQPKSIFSRSV